MIGRFLLAWFVLLALPLLAQEASPAPEATPAQLPTPLRHLILLDVSGSMRNRGYAHRGPDGRSTVWAPPLPDFVSKLLTGFSPQDEVVVLPFSESVTDAKEGRAASAPVSLQNLSAVAANLPTPGGGATNMTYALDRAVPQYAPAGTTLVWLITDNENNIDTQQNDQEFYERLSGQAAGHEKDYSHVLFFPIASHQVHGSDPSLGDNLVMYLLIPGQGERPWVDTLMEQVKKSTGFSGVIFRPLYADPGRPVLDFSQELKVQGRGPKVRQEGGTTVLTFEEGDTLRGKVGFKVRSHLKGWKIENATLDDAAVDLQIPPGYEGAGNRQLVWEVSPKNLSVEPEKESADFFLLDLAGARLKTQAPATPAPGGGPRKPAGPVKKAGPMVLSRSWGKFLSDPFARFLPTIGGKVTVTATLKVAPEDIEQGSIKPAFEPEVRERLKAVRYLADIERFMVLQDDLPGMGEQEEDKNKRTITFERKLAIRVKANPVGGWLALGALALVLAALVGGVLALTVWKAHYALAGPTGSEEFSLPYLWGAWLISSPDGIPLATLAQRWGSARLVPEPDVAINGLAEVTPVDWETSEFRAELTPEGKPTLHYTLTRASGASKINAGQEDGPSL